MNKYYTGAGIPLRIWFITSLILTAILSVYFYNTFGFSLPLGAVTFIAPIIGSIPALIVLLIAVPVIKRVAFGWQARYLVLLLVQFTVTLFYGCIGAVLNIPITISYSQSSHFFYTGITVSAILFISSCIASLIILKRIAFYFSEGELHDFSFPNLFLLLFQHTSKKTITMENFEHTEQLPLRPQSQSNRLLIKGLITGGLILLMLIPTVFITGIIHEREQRQIEVVKEVSSKWASSQALAGPYFVIPYIDTTVNNDGKTIASKKQLIILAADLNVNGNIFREERPRSIYKVLLYKSDLNIKGFFKPVWPMDINVANIDFANAKLCFGLSDFKGIEEEIYVKLNNQRLTLAPGLPLNDIDGTGLSAPVSLTNEIINSGISFDIQVKIKGSGQLHFLPLSSNSKFNISSTWPDPSFDGNSLPNERAVNQNGFAAKWNFNQANLPFGTVLRQGSFNKMNLDFGVSMVQPADQYNKTMRSVKYAILFIGLTFALFFIIEIMQRKPFHPVQYVLVGLALVIFYTLLLSISEYLLFDLAYLIAASATIMLISLYAKGHFASWKTAGIFFTALSLLYGFIFILIRLEDTALLVGSIGLFIVLALVMYVSRKINWYGEKAIR